MADQMTSILVHLTIVTVQVLSPVTLTEIQDLEGTEGVIEMLETEVMIEMGEVGKMIETEETAKSEMEEILVSMIHETTEDKGKELMVVLGKIGLGQMLMMEITRTISTHQMEEIIQSGETDMEILFLPRKQIPNTLQRVLEVM